MPRNRFSSMLLTSLSRHPRISPSPRDKEIAARVNCARYLAISPDGVSRGQCRWRCVMSVSAASCSRPHCSQLPITVVSLWLVTAMHSAVTPPPRSSLGGSVCCGSSLITGVTLNVKIAVIDIASVYHAQPAHASFPARWRSSSCWFTDALLWSGDRGRPTTAVYSASSGFAACGGTETVVCNGIFHRSN